MTDPDPSNTVAAQDLRSTDSAEPSPAQGPATGADDAPTAPVPAEEPGRAHGRPDVVPGAGVRYAALRLLMLVSVGGILYIVGLRGWALLFAAVLLSAIASWFVFMRQREAAARNLEARLAARAARRDPESPSSTSSGASSPAGSEG